jgi:serine/threonine-protein kinase
MNPRKQPGRYQVVRVLGRDAMGEVYEGVDPRLNRIAPPAPLAVLEAGEADKADQDAPRLAPRPLP